jgi:hypothetical protein
MSRASLAHDQWLGAPPPKLSKGGKYRLSGRRFSVALPDSPPNSQMDNYNIFRSSCSSDVSSPGSKGSGLSESATGRSGLSEEGSGKSKGSSSSSSSCGSSGSSAGDSPGGSRVESDHSTGDVSDSSTHSSPRMAPVELITPPLQTPYTFHRASVARAPSPAAALAEQPPESFSLIMSDPVRPPHQDHGREHSSASAQPGVACPAVSTLSLPQEGRSPQERSPQERSPQERSPQERSPQERSPQESLREVSKQQPVPSERLNILELCQDYSVTSDLGRAISENIKSAMETQLAICQQEAGALDTLTVMSTGTSSVAAILPADALKLQVSRATAVALHAAQAGVHFYAAQELFRVSSRSSSGGGFIDSLAAIRLASTAHAFRAGCSVLRALTQQARGYSAVLEVVLSGRADARAAGSRAGLHAGSQSGAPHQDGDGQQDSAEVLCIAKENMNGILLTVADVAFNTRAMAWAVNGGYDSVRQMEAECARVIQNAPHMRTTFLGTTALGAALTAVETLYTRLRSTLFCSRT